MPEDLIPILLRFYENKETGASTFFKIDSEPLKKLVEKRRNGFWLYALVEPGTKVFARIVRKGVEKEKIFEITQAGMITSNGFFAPLNSSSGVFKLLLEEESKEKAECP
ncbi:MAG: hypothetical protein QW566_08135 [Candidatus Jordarchaeales archaeon]